MLRAMMVIIVPKVGMDLVRQVRRAAQSGVSPELNRGNLAQLTSPAPRWADSPQTNERSPRAAAGRRATHWGNSLGTALIGPPESAPHVHILLGRTVALVRITTRAPSSLAQLA